MRINYLNRVYAVLSAINETIVREKDPQRMLAAACRIAVEIGRFRMVWAGRVDEATQRVVVVASAGVTDGYLDRIELGLGKTAAPTSAASRALAQGMRAVCNDIGRDTNFGPWKEEASKRGYRSSALFPLKVGGRIVGLFELYATESGFFDDQELRLLDELAMDISFALEVHELEKEGLRSQAALRASEERFRELAENIQEVFWVANATKDRTIYVSPAYEKTWGRTCDSLLRAPGDWVKAVHPEDRERVLKAFSGVQNPDGFDVRYRILRPDGSVRWIQDRAFPVRGVAGEARRFVGVARDITEGRQIAAELERREEWFRSLIENASDLIHGVGRPGDHSLSEPFIGADSGLPSRGIDGQECLRSAAPGRRGSGDRRAATRENGCGCRCADRVSSAASGWHVAHVAIRRAEPVEPGWGRIHGREFARYYREQAARGTTAAVGEDGSGGAVGRRGSPRFQQRAIRNRHQ